MAFEGYGSHRTQGSYTHALGDYRLQSLHFILFIRDRFLLCCLSCLEFTVLPYLPSVGIVGTDYIHSLANNPNFHGEIEAQGKGDTLPTWLELESVTQDPGTLALLANQGALLIPHLLMLNWLQPI